MKSKFERINRLPPYIFGEINSLKMKLRSEGRDIIDFGMGNPDMPTPLHIRQKLKEVIDKPGVGRYSVSKGINGLRKAQAKYYCLLYTSPSPRDLSTSRMPSSA